MPPQMQVLAPATEMQHHFRTASGASSLHVACKVASVSLKIETGKGLLVQVVTNSTHPSQAVVRLLEHTSSRQPAAGFSRKFDLPLHHAV
mmetsp:Transcript_37693/g.74172  ORF Transcript_37693/g.74172 Transcript_37693/m.74172 type:complete len:90 (+) Transcript_37693:174-443(+)